MLAKHSHLGYAHMGVTQKKSYFSNGVRAAPAFGRAAEVGWRALC